MKQVLIAESLDEKVLAEFSNKGVKFVYKPEITPQQLEHEIKPYDGLIVRPKPVSATAIAHAIHLKLIIRGGAGVNSIALDECKKRGIIVENTPGLNSDATAEFTILSMLKLYKPNRELKGKKLGIIGNGNIGKRVAKIAESFGMEVIIHSRSSGISLSELLSASCDIISLHIPLTAETENLISEKEFAQMKPGTILINTARPQLVDVKAFANALKSGKISAFAIDGDEDLVQPFINIDSNQQGLITPHIADATEEAQANITRHALYQAVEFFLNKIEINRVT